MKTYVDTILLSFGIYLLIGLIFSFLFLWKGITKVDPNSKGSSLGTRLMFLPAMTVFWILFLRKWLTASSNDSNT
ncbi:hypothetical protein [Sediminitomix flava]|uniref:Phospholipase D-like protein n=1 Tax=Sediminitomix flava TaxID=379075 RepID=A0A315ZHF2_SEDFL|nr:hypothetical protein [Sediminitomix flava]PWJ44722.1 hypothetical protein BC781_1011093 [Sediminitomix flava]